MSIFSKYFGKPLSHPIDAEHNWIADGTYPQMWPDTVVYRLKSAINENDIIYVCFPYEQSLWNFMCQKSNYKIPFEFPFASTRFREKKIHFSPIGKDIVLYVFDTLIGVVK